AAPRSSSPCRWRSTAPRPNGSALSWRPLAHIRRRWSGVLIPSREQRPMPRSAFRRSSIARWRRRNRASSRYGSADRGGKVPVVEIESRTFEAEPHGNTIHVPVFRLVDWELWDGVPTPMAQPVAVPIAPPPKAVTARAVTAKPATRQPQSDVDLDDEIPF